ncbi:reverse transcriptase domain-containing protein [Tanacetum coccineum]
MVRTVRMQSTQDLGDLVYHVDTPPDKTILIPSTYSHAEAWSWDKTRGEANVRCLLDRLAEHQDSIGGRLLSFLTDLCINKLVRERKGWVDELHNVWWAHRTSLKTSNGETSYSLTFGSEEVIPAKIGIPTHRTMMIKEGEGNEEEMRLNLDLLQEKKEAATIREARYKMKMEHYYNKRVPPMSFKVGEYVYRKNEASMVENLGKLGPKWKGPYLVGKRIIMAHTSCEQWIKERCLAFGMQST